MNSTLLVVIGSGTTHIENRSRFFYVYGYITCPTLKVWLTYDILIVFHHIYVSILHHFQDIAIFIK